ncbi:MAG: hypothetical protein WAW61_11810 [Methylococcaceae bacterium]
MKKLPLITIICVLAISIPAAYLGFQAYNNMGVNRQAENDFSNELAIVKSEISAFKEATSELSEIKQKIAQLEIQKRNNVLQAQTQHDGKNGDDQQDIAQALPKSPMEMAQEEEEQSSKALALINKAFLAESSDQQWTPETTNLITSFFDSENGANLNVSDIQCRKTLCKVELNRVDGTKAANDLSLNFPAHVGQALSQARYFHEQNDDGTTNLTIYLARNGYEFPSEL